MSMWTSDLKEGVNIASDEGFCFAEFDNVGVHKFYEAEEILDTYIQVRKEKKRAYLFLWNYFQYSPNLNEGVKAFARYTLDELELPDFGSNSPPLYVTKKKREKSNGWLL